MVLTLTKPCRRCGGDGFFREPDPAGRGQLERCPNCNPGPARPKSAFVRSDLWHLAGARGGFTLWHYEAGMLLAVQTSAPGFFDSAHDLVQRGDRIMVSATDGACDLHVVSASEAGGVVVQALRATGVA